MSSNRDAGFTDIDDLLPPPEIPPTFRSRRIAELEDEIQSLQKRCMSLSDIVERRVHMHNMQQELNKRLDAEIRRQKTQIEELQKKHNDAIESMAAQASEARDYRLEIEYLQGLVDQLQPPVDQLNDLQLQLKTYRLAVNVLFDLLRHSHPNTPIDEILAECKAQVLAVDAAKGIFHDHEPTTRHEGDDDGVRDVGDFIDDIASEASHDETIADDDSLHDFLEDGEDISRPPAAPERKRKARAPTKEERDDTDFAPSTPKRARASAVRAPITPPSSQRKNLPRKAKLTPKGSAFYNLKRLSDAGRGNQ